MIIAGYEAVHPGKLRRHRRPHDQRFDAKNLIHGEGNDIVGNRIPHLMNIHS